MKCILIVFLVIITRCCCHQSSYLQIESKNKGIIQTERVQPFLHLQVHNDIECYMRCLQNQDKCCLVEVKNWNEEGSYKCLIYDICLIYLNTTFEKNSKIISVLNRDCKFKPRNCLEWLQKGRNEDGVYLIYLKPGNSTKVFCDMTGGGWTIFQKRFNGSVDFSRGWNDFKHGFGNINGEYCLGNDIIHLLTDKPGDVLIKFDTTSLDNVRKYVVFNGFKVEGEEKKYKMHIGEAVDGDEHLVHTGKDQIHDRLNEMKFTSIDNDNDEFSNNCAGSGRGAFWYRSCSLVTPNSGYPSGICDEKSCMRWKRWRIDEDITYLNFFQMSIK